MLSELSIEQLAPIDYEVIRSVYAACDYSGGINEDDIGFLASLRGIPAAAVRLTNEEGVLMLRGMMVKPEYQRHGIGKQVLQALDPHIGKNACYLVGRKHLIDFYGGIGFKKIEPSEAPDFLRDRAQLYNTNGYECILMYRSPRP